VAELNVDCGCLGNSLTEAIRTPGFESHRVGVPPRNPPPVGLEISIGGFRFTAPAVLLSDFYGNIAGSYESLSMLSA
jgi:hypothetical protein